MLRERRENLYKSLKKTLYITKKVTTMLVNKFSEVSLMGRRLVNQETGEILEEPDFVKVYINDLCRVKGVTGLQMNIFHFMLKHMNDYNEVSYGKSAKERFCVTHQTSSAAFNNNINALISAGLIQRVNRGEFRVNKKYAVKVDWDRVQSIVWTSVYSEKGLSETIEFKEKK